jgi:hypothetical protein
MQLRDRGPVPGDDEGRPALDGAKNGDRVVPQLALAGSTVLLCPEHGRKVPVGALLNVVLHGR